MSTDEEVLEVCLTDAGGKEYVYWVRLRGQPQNEDAYDWAISIARAYHNQAGLAPIPDDALNEEEDLMTSAFASEPFERESGEYTWAN